VRASSKIQEQAKNFGVRFEVVRNADFYNLDAIISVGYRVNSVRAFLQQGRS
jgi:hypothetical protein